MNTIYNVDKMKSMAKKRETSKFSGLKAELVSSINHISQSNNNVNSDTSTKHSMQINQKIHKD